MNQTENEPKQEEQKESEPLPVVTEPKVMKFSIPNKERLPKSEENLIEHAFGLDQNDSHEHNESMKVELDPVEAEKEIAVAASPYKRLSIKDELKAEPKVEADQNVTNNATTSLEIQIEAKEEKENVHSPVEEVKQEIEKSPRKEEQDIEMKLPKEEDNAIEVKEGTIKENDNIEIAVSSQSSKHREASSKKSNHIQVINLSKSKSKEKVLSTKKEEIAEPILPPHMININEIKEEAQTFIDDFTQFLKQENLCIRNDELYELDSPSQSLYENVLFWKFLILYLSKRAKERKDIQLSMLYLIRLTNRAISYIKGDDDAITSFKELVCEIIRDNFKPEDFFFMLSLKNIKDSDAEKENKITLPLLEHLLSKPEPSPISSKRKKSSAVKPLISNIELCINKENEISFEHCRKMQFSKRKVLMEANDSFCMNGVVVVKKDEATEKEEEEKEEIIDTCRPTRKTKNKKEAKNSVTSIKSDEDEENDSEEEEIKGKIKRKGKSKMRKTASTKSRNKSNRKTKKH